MKTYNFEIRGVSFSFRNPQWKNTYKHLEMDYKVIGIAENSVNDGYFNHSVFSPRENMMTLHNVELEGKVCNGVVLPDEILNDVKALYEELKEKALKEKMNSDIRYTVNDTTAYGIYNGISEFDINEIINSIKTQYGIEVPLYGEEISQILNRDEELRQIAMESYQVFPLHDEVSHREEISNKTAPGYGLIPNSVIREKITHILQESNVIQMKVRSEEQERISKIFETAKLTGQKQLIRKWIEECNDKDEECNLDCCCEWALPDGAREKTRTHTW